MIMEPKESSVLLAKVAAYDRRTVGKADSVAWAESLSSADVSFDDALQAVTGHFSESNDWLMPVHVIRRVRDLRRARVNNAPRPELPPNLHQEQERAWLAHYWAAVKAGADGPRSVADARMGISRPALSAPDPGRLTAIIGAGVNPDPFSRGMAGGDAA